MTDPLNPLPSPKMADDDCMRHRDAILPICFGVVTKCQRV